MISKESCEKYAEVCRFRRSRLMDISESVLFEALEKVCRQAAEADPLQRERDDLQNRNSLLLATNYDLRKERDRLIDERDEAEALLKATQHPTQYAVIPPGWVYMRDQFLAPDSASVCLHQIHNGDTCEICGAKVTPVVQPERCCVDYPRCDCNSPPEPDDDWLCFQRPAQPKVTP